MKAWQAHGPAGTATSVESPRSAAITYFESYPKSRKCDITEGTYDGFFFTVHYGRYTEGHWPKQWKNVTKRTLDDLPETWDVGGPHEQG